MRKALRCSRNFFTSYSQKKILCKKGRQRQGVSKIVIMISGGIKCPS
jgi:hypothetical protein|nr:MAG TPA: hypothetical protein [Caudoviricetes sp.]